MSLLLVLVELLLALLRVHWGRRGNRRRRLHGVDGASRGGSVAAVEGGPIATDESSGQLDHALVALEENEWRGEGRGGDERG